MPVEPAAAFAPGRVNLIGEHTDYNGGLALAFPIEPGVRVTATRLGGDRVEAHAADLGERDRFPLADPPPAPGWRAFVRGTVAELARAGVSVPAARIEISGELPRGAGLASSAALCVALALALTGLEGAGSRDEVLRLARLCSRVESDWAGQPTGLLDQLTILAARPGEALLLDFGGEPSWSPVALPEDLNLAVVDSGAPRALAGSGYADRRRECEHAARLLGVGALSEAEPAAIEQLPAGLAPRLRHVLSENARVRAAADALAAGRAERLGPLLAESHRSLRDDFEASVPAVERTVAAAEAAGALGARMMGGGFGGSVLALFEAGAEPPAEARKVRPGGGARAIW